MQQRRMSTAGGSSSSSDRGPASWWSDNANAGAFMLSVAIGTAGLSYASVPLYRMFCQATGFGGTVRTHKGGDEADGYDLPADPATLRNNRLLTISFNTDVDTSLPWSFKPVQRQVNVLAGQTALAFFEATNHSDEPIIGVATYNVAPMQAGAYFNKIQCFCFDEQRLLPGETVDMPVFFYVDPEFLKDRRMHKCNVMTLSYTFFRSSEWEEKSSDPREQQHLTTTTGEPSGVYWKAPAPETAVTVTAEVTPAVAAAAPSPAA